MLILYFTLINVLLFVFHFLTFLRAKKDNKLLTARIEEGIKALNLIALLRGNNRNGY